MIYVKPEDQKPSEEKKKTWTGMPTDGAQTNDTSHSDLEKWLSGMEAKYNIDNKKDQMTKDQYTEKRLTSNEAPRASPIGEIAQKPNSFLDTGKSTVPILKKGLNRGILV